MLIPKFRIGQTVYSKVPRMASSEPCTAPAGSKFKVTGIHKTYNGYVYTCEDYDIYEFKENELMGGLEYTKKLLKERSGK